MVFHYINIWMTIYSYEELVRQLADYFLVNSPVRFATPIWSFFPTGQAYNSV